MSTTKIAPNRKTRSIGRTNRSGNRKFWTALLVCPLLAGGVLMGWASLQNDKEGLVVRGRTARQWVESLASDDPEERTEAAEVLLSLGHKGVPQLGRALRHRNVAVRRKAASLLRKLGGESQTAVDDLARALQDSDSSVRLQSAEALRNLGRGASDAVFPLASALTDDDARVRQVAARALGSIGPPAVMAHPALMKAMQDERLYVRRAASSAIAKIFPDH